jgi:type I restriction enzyme M protein
MANDETIRSHAAFIWSIADLLRGDYKQSEYGKVVLPLTVILRLDCVLDRSERDVGAGSRRSAPKLLSTAVDRRIRPQNGEEFQSYPTDGCQSRL